MKKPTISKVVKYVLDDIQQAIVTIFKNKKLQGKLLPLSGGFSLAKVFKFTVDDNQYVLKYLSDIEPDKNQREIKANQLAASLKISPELIFVNDQQNIMISRYIQGGILTQALYADQKIKNKIVSIFNQLNQIDMNIIPP